MSNSQGSYASTTERTMAAYDKLPRSARQALAGANFDWATQPFLSGFEGLRGKRRRWATGKELAAYIRKIDDAETGKRCAKLYGPDHPQAEAAPRQTRRRK